MTQRRLEWPPSAAVSLLDELPWLALYQSAASEWQARVPVVNNTPSRSWPHRQQQPSRAQLKLKLKLNAKPAASTSSPLQQKLCRPRDPAPPPASPAQRAARKMLRLEETWQQAPVSYGSRRDNAGMFSMTSGAPGTTDINTDLTSSPPAVVSPLTISSTRLSSSPPRYRQASAPSIEGNAVPMARKPPHNSAHRANSVQPMAHDLHSQQVRLADWVARTGENQDRGVIEYSSEMAAVMQHRMTATLGTGPWRDPVTSMLAAEMTSESLFGGELVATRRLAFPISAASVSREQAPTTTEAGPITVAVAVIQDARLESGRPLSDQKQDAPPPDYESSSMVADFAAETHARARHLRAEGRVHDALTVLQEGITRVLHAFQANQDHVQGDAGFNYSQHAHDMATRVQLVYRARHRQRVRHVVVLQRIWRRVHVHRHFVRERRYQHVEATRIQRQYRAHARWRRREVAATRIQRWRRDRNAHRGIYMLMQACYQLCAARRRARAQKARRARRWAKLRTVVAWVSIWKARHAFTTRVQALWRARCARVSYTIHRQGAVDAEFERQRREDAFVMSRLPSAMDGYATFVRHTAMGHRLVDWVQKKRWVRWSRLRAKDQWATVPLATRAAALCDMVSCLQQDAEMKVHGPRLQSILAVLAHGLASNPAPFAVQSMHLTTEQILTVLQPGPRSTFDCTSDSSMPLDGGTTATAHSGLGKIKHNVKTTMNRLGRACASKARGIQNETRLVTLRLLWRWVYYPEYRLRAAFASHAHARAQAIRELEQDQRLLLRVFLRHVYRSLSQRNAPNQVCAWCSDGFATVKELYTHFQSGGCNSSKAATMREWQDSVQDVRYLQQTRWLWPLVCPHSLFEPIVRAPASAPAPRNESMHSHEEYWNGVRSRLQAQRHRAAIHALVNAVAARCALHSQDHYAVEETAMLSTALVAGGDLVSLQLVSFLLQSVDEELHPLLVAQQMKFQPRWNVKVPPGGWIPLAELQNLPNDGQIVTRSRLRRILLRLQPRLVATVANRIHKYAPRSGADGSQAIPYGSGRVLPAS